MNGLAETRKSLKLRVIHYYLDQALINSDDKRGGGELIMKVVREMAGDWTVVNYIELNVSSLFLCS
jgi:hypothetical protein